jgi:hypothetical protein
MRLGTMTSLALASALAVAAPVLRAEDKPMGPPKPAPEMSQLAIFGGTWGCTGKAFASPMGPEHATEGSVHAGSGLGGFWYVVHYDEKKTAANPMPYHVGMFMGYDATAKLFVQSCHDSLGGYCRETSKGWAGDTLLFEGEAMGMGPKMNVRDVFTKKGPAELVHAGEIQGADGKWTKMDEETCRKVAAKK